MKRPDSALTGRDGRRRRQPKRRALRFSTENGIAHAILCAESFVGDDPFCAYLGDNVLKGGIRSVVQDLLTTGNDAEVMLCRVPNPEMFGVAELDQDGDTVSLVEKPKAPKSDLALVGI